MPSQSETQCVQISVLTTLANSMTMCLALVRSCCQVCAAYATNVLMATPRITLLLICPYACYSMSLLMLSTLCCNTAF